jgi:hypothetical protein
MFAVIWAWINFTWFASAYDTDDWVFRVVTMIQMVGVLILAMGIEPMFHSLVEGKHVDNTVIVGGYVIMRLALVFPVAPGRPAGSGTQRHLPALRGIPGGGPAWDGSRCCSSRRTCSPRS